MSETAKHTLMGGKLHLYKRENSYYWQCSTFLGNKNHRVSTKETSLARAKDFAEDWYLELLGKHKRGEIKNEKTFKQAAEQFLREFEIITKGERNAGYVKDHHRRINLHLIPFFGEMGLSQITAGQIQEYRIHRYNQGTEGKKKKPPARNTIHQELVALRQTLKCAIRHGWLQGLPDFTEPYRASNKISHRGWFSPEEYKQLYTATRERAKNPKTKRWKWQSEQLHDYVLFMGNTGLRPDEAARLQYRDVVIVKGEDTKEILEISVRGKRGVGYCKSMSGAVEPFKRLVKRNNPKGTDIIFEKKHRELFNAILEEEGLKKDREGQVRTSYSLRHTYISMRLMEGADIYQIAKNCRTSVEMIEKYYASHIKNMLNVSAINVKKRKSSRKRVETSFDSLLEENP